MNTPLSRNDENQPFTFGESGEYTLHFDGGRLRCLRHGEEWRNLTGDKMVLALMEEAQKEHRRAEAFKEAMHSYRDAAVAERDARVVSETQPTILERAIQAFIQTCAGPAFTRDEIREEAKHIVNKTGFYSEDAK